MRSKSFADLPSFPYTQREHTDVTSVRLRGSEILHNPVYNKGTAHSMMERERLGLRGLLPPRIMTLEQQMDKVMDQYWHGSDFIDPSQVSEGGITHEHTRKWTALTELQDRNETLFYRVLMDNFVEMAPIIYTPTVGWACMNFHKLYRRARGMYFSALDRGMMGSMVHSWPQEDVDAIVITDGSRILGLGDLGCNGLGISVGKLDLYVAAGGFHPGRVLPCVVDVGTDNERLRQDPWYFGLKQERLTGDAYYEIVDEAVRALMHRWPRAVLQFEDFAMPHAGPLLERYRSQHCVFNDDIQGTACVAVAGLYGALRVQGQPPAALTQQRFVVVGAGSAGMGVAGMIAEAMVKQGLSLQQARERFYIVDHRGLVTQARPDLPPHVVPFARPPLPSDELGEGAQLLSVVDAAKPTVLIGLAGAGRLFSKDVLQSMARHNDRPIVFPMSNPTSKMECTHEDAVTATGGRAIFASGSPQPRVQLEGRTHIPSQANNMYVFPGLALGAHLARSNRVTNDMLMSAAEAVPAFLSDHELGLGLVYPNLNAIREISVGVAATVIKSAAEEGLLRNRKAAKALDKGDEELQTYIQSTMYYPEYSNLVYQKNH
ncbi:malic enzyme [Helicosporidium sp. ATCC 50920]|nr:malic enzyme [Helicosporidium sp. ATCC 50920]|eukprot:KDD76796.1 malic enzyme [Helicosporidium sp. ATCC 50920]